jgi:hypothetical protein
MTGDEVFEAEWEDLTEKEILVGILSELQQIRVVLSQADSGAQSESDGDVMYRCRRCPDGTEVAKGDRERHATKQHKAPVDMVDSMFERVE